MRLGSLTMTLPYHPFFKERSAGVLLHLTSLPCGGKTLDGACAFADWLAESGFRWWQMLPIGPLPENVYSPYSAKSSFRQGDFVGGKWDAFRGHCEKVGIRLMGDLPIFVPAASEDVVENPELFRLDSGGRPSVQTGVPPDCFSESGQLWGHPHYNWPAHHAENFAWWVRRIQTQLNWFDAIRIDHFIGFYHAFEIDGKAETAEEGVWELAPGREILQALVEERGAVPLPLIAEDLGLLTPEVEALRDDFGLPGMRLLQNGDALDAHHVVAYTGTHDNNTTQGWIDEFAARGVAPPYSSLGQAIETLWQSEAPLALIPMQDLLGLGAEARMNIPGQIEGQWRWQLPTGALSKRLAAQIQERLGFTARLVTKS